MIDGVSGAILVHHQCLVESGKHFLVVGGWEGLSVRADTQPMEGEEKGREGGRDMHNPCCVC